MRRLLASTLAAAALLAAHEAPAQGTDLAAAQGLFDQAKALVAAGKVAEACPKFLASYKFDPKPGTAVNLADCYEKNGQIASAWARYLEAASLAERAGQAERAQYAKDHAAALQPNVARITITTPAAPRGLEVRRDGELIEAAVLGTPLPVDPGKHVVEARAPGKKTWTKEVEIQAGRGNVAIEIPALQDDAAELAPVSSPGAALPPGAALSPLAAPPAGAPSAFLRKPLGIALTAVGGAGVVVGAITGAMAIGKHASLASACKDPNACSGQDDAISSYHTLGTVSDVGLIAGGALAATGIVLVVTAPKAASAKQGWVTPVLGPAFAGIAGRF